MINHTFTFKTGEMADIVNLYGLLKTIVEAYLMSFVHAADPEITNMEIDPETEDLVVDYFELLGENEFSYHQKTHVPMDNVKKNILFYIEKTNYLDYHNLLWLRDCLEK